MGTGALRKNLKSGNTAIGHGAMGYSPDGIDNVAIGILAICPYDTTVTGGGTTTDEFTGLRNVAIGAKALQFGVNAASFNVAIGYCALFGNLVRGADHYHGAGDNPPNTQFYAGADPANVAGDVTHGPSGVTGNENVAIGHYSLPNLTTATAAIAIGYASGYNTTKGSYNISIGYESLYSYTDDPGSDLGNNIAIGYQAGYGITTGSDNICIGKQAGKNVTPDRDGTLIIHNSASGATIFADMDNKNVGVSGYTSDFGGGIGCFAIITNTTPSTTSVSGGVVLWFDGTDLKYRYGSTTKTITAA